VHSRNIVSCPLCNSHKSDKTEALDLLTGATVALFNPRTRSWWDHFAWADDGIGILGTSPIGRATVGALYLSDDPDALAVRSYRVLAGWHPPRD